MSVGEPIRVMLVDDHKSLLWGLNKLIQGEAPRMEVVATASNRPDALRLARESRPDLILLDVDMGEGVNSLDFLPELIAVSGAHVIILTGAQDRETHDRAVDCGARGILLKEEPAETIVKAIEKVCGGEYWLDRAAAGRALDRSRNPAPRQDAPSRGKLDELTPAELKVIKAVVGQAGASNKEIAASLNMSVKTLNNHLTSIHAKLDVKNRLDLFLYAIKNGLAQLPG